MTDTTANATEEMVNVPRDLRRALLAIAEGYELSVHEDRYIVVSNPDYDPTDISDPSLVIDVQALAAAPTRPASEGVVLERAPEDQAAIGWTIPVEVLADVSRKVTDAEWDAPTIEVVEIVMLEAERRILACISPHQDEVKAENERLRKTLIWYESVVRMTRGVEAKQARDMLTRDGGKRAYTALNASEER